MAFVKPKDAQCQECSREYSRVLPKVRTSIVRLRPVAHRNHTVQTKLFPPCSTPNVCGPTADPAPRGKTNMCNHDYAFRDSQNSQLLGVPGYQGLWERRPHPAVSGPVCYAFFLGIVCQCKHHESCDLFLFRPFSQRPNFDF